RACAPPTVSSAARCRARRHRPKAATSTPAAASPRTAAAPRRPRSARSRRATSAAVILPVSSTCRLLFSNYVPLLHAVEERLGVEVRHPASLYDRRSCWLKDLLSLPL